MQRPLRGALGALLVLTMAGGTPLAAQDPGREVGPPESPAPSPQAPPTIFDGDWATLGGGIAYGSSYDGSDDYVVSALPFLQGRLGGVAINPRPAGLALDFVHGGGGKVDVNLGVAGRLNRNRADQIEDDVVEAYGELDTAIEVGPTVGVSVSKLLNPFDSLSVGADVLWDIAGAHNGMTINPSITYFTPVSRGTAVSLSLSARYVDDDYAAFYYSVPAAPATVPVGDRLPVFAAEGGWDKIGANLLLAQDLDNDVTNGGIAAFLIGGYSRMQGDGAETPFTSLRGDPDQWFAAVGLGYSF